jgi:hypothetical protein
MATTRVRRCPGYTGLDTLRYLLPQAVQARLLAKTFFRDWEEETFKQDLCTVQTPAGLTFVVYGVGKVRRPTETERAILFSMP